MPKRKPSETTADELLGVLKEAHKDLVKDLELLTAKALAATGNGETWNVAVTKRQIGMVKARIEELGGSVLGAAGKDGLAAQLTDAAYKVGLKSIDFGLNLQGIAPGLPDAALHMGISRGIAQELTEGYSGMYQRILREHADEFRDIQARSVMSAIAKGDTADALIGKIVEQIKDRAQDGKFKLPGGSRNWSVEDYAEMLSRTVAAKAEREASRARMIEEETDLVIVIGGLIGTSCETCQKAHGKVLSLTGRTPGYPTVAEFEAMSPPIWHVRCGHSMGPYYPESGLSEEEVRAELETFEANTGFDVRWEGTTLAKRPEARAKPKAIPKVKALPDKVAEAFGGWHGEQPKTQWDEDPQIRGKSVGGYADLDNGVAHVKRTPGQPHSERLRETHELIHFTTSDEGLKESWVGEGATDARATLHMWREEKPILAPMLKKKGARQSWADLKTDRERFIRHNHLSWLDGDGMGYKLEVMELERASLAVTVEGGGSFADHRRRAGEWLRKRLDSGTTKQLIGDIEDALAPRLQERWRDLAAAGKLPKWLLMDIDDIEFLGGGAKRYRLLAKRALQEQSVWDALVEDAVGEPLKGLETSEVLLDGID